MRAPLPASAIAPHFDRHRLPTLRSTASTDPRPDRGAASTPGPGPQPIGSRSNVPASSKGLQHCYQPKPWEFRMSHNGWAKFDILVMGVVADLHFTTAPHLASCPSFRHRLPGDGCARSTAEIIV